MAYEQCVTSSKLRWGLSKIKQQKMSFKMNFLLMEITLDRTNETLNYTLISIMLKMTQKIFWKRVWRWFLFCEGRSFGRTMQYFLQVKMHFKQKLLDWQRIWIWWRLWRAKTFFGMTKDGNTTGVDKFPCLGTTCHTSMTFVTRYNWRGIFSQKKSLKGFASEFSFCILIPDCHKLDIGYYNEMLRQFHQHLWTTFLTISICQKYKNKIKLKVQRSFYYNFCMKKLPTRKMKLTKVK